MRIAAWPAFKNRSENPYNWLLYSHLQELGLEIKEFDPKRLVIPSYDIWHLHWPRAWINLHSRAEAIAKMAILTYLVTVARTQGTKIVWTAHNVTAHENLYPQTEAWFGGWFIPRLDGVIALSEKGSELTRNRYPDLREKPTAVVPHGHYVGAYPNDISREEAREQLGLEADHRVLLFLGQVRPYKNVPHLIRQFRKLGEENSRLIVAGKVNPASLKREIEQAVGDDTKVQLHLRFVEDHELQVFLNAADLLILPYLEVLNSGTAILGLSFSRPILVPDIGALGELAAQFGPPLVTTFSGELTAEIIARTLQTVIGTPADSRLIADRVTREMDWHIIAKDTRSFYIDLLEGGTEKYGRIVDR